MSEKYNKWHIVRWLDIRVGLFVRSERYEKWLNVHEPVSLRSRMKRAWGKDSARVLNQEAK